MLTTVTNTATDLVDDVVGTAAPVLTTVTDTATDLVDDVVETAAPVLTTVTDTATTWSMTWSGRPRRCWRRSAGARQRDRHCDRSGR